MCGRLACSLCPNDIVNNCKYTNHNNTTEVPDWFQTSYEYTPIYNGAPSTVLPVLVHSENLHKNIQEKPEYSITPMRWGMLLNNKPESASANFHTHNARLENVLNSFLYKPQLMNGRRCVILADGYYEWQTTKGKNFKQPYYIYQSLNEEDTNSKEHLMKFAGLYSITKDENRVKYSCSMLTTEADTSLQWMHHRMPVILNTNEDIFNWLNSKTHNYEKALEKLPTYANWDKKYQLKYYPVNKSYVNNTSTDSEQCREKISISDNKRKAGTLDGWIKRVKH